MENSKSISQLTSQKSIKQPSKFRKSSQDFNINFGPFKTIDRIYDAKVKKLVREAQWSVKAQHDLMQRLHEKYVLSLIFPTLTNPGFQGAKNMFYSKISEFHKSQDLKSWNNEIKRKYDEDAK